MGAERCLVTGGAGFIGSNLVHELLARGFGVRVLDDLELIEGDLRDAGSVAAAVAGISRVFHQGAISSVLRSVQDPVRSHEVNSTGTVMLLWACRDAGVERVVYASSSSVYGNAQSLPVHEGILV